MGLVLHMYMRARNTLKLKCLEKGITFAMLLGVYCLRIFSDHHGIFRIEAYKDSLIREILPLLPLIVKWSSLGVGCT